MSESSVEIIEDTELPLQTAQTTLLPCYQILVTLPLHNRSLANRTSSWWSLTTLLA